MSHPYSGRRVSLLWMVCAYAVVALSGWLTLQACVTMHPVWAMLIADVVATSALFVFSRVLNNSSMYDPYWSLVPIYIALWWWLGVAEGGGGLRAVLTVGVITLWGGRLTWNFLRGWPGLVHEDWRYVDFRESTGRWYWLVSYWGIHMFPTLLVFAGLLPVCYTLLEGETAIGVLGVVGASMSCLAVVIQGVADNQLKHFRATRSSSDAILEIGLWRYSRHPNYFGEVLFWWGLYVIVLDVSLAHWWTVVGALGMTALFVFASVPMTDKQTLKSRPHYEAHMKKVSGLVPWFRREG